MAWIPLSHRINHLPLVLAGPILRRTEPDSVTVWVALKEACKVTLKVYSTADGKGAILNQLLLSGSRSTIELGQYLHIVAVTATVVESHLPLEPAQIYAYDLNFGKAELNLSTALNSPGIPPVKISYFEHQLPTFAMPADNLNHLQLVQGSCRKLHGGGRDALPMLDNLMVQSAQLAHYRPQQLFLTGDQIYGDDVADPLLWALSDAGDTLLGWEELLPLKQGVGEWESGRVGEWESGGAIQTSNLQPPTSNLQPPTSNLQPPTSNLKPPTSNLPCSQLKPGQRCEIAENCAGLTAMLVNKPEKAKSHLFSLGEYSAMYLFTWSPVLWPDKFPKGATVRKDTKQAKLWDKEARILQDLVGDLWKIRRVLANVSTYMICDDHDISDDWYLNLSWCNQVLSQPLGRRVVQNGLLAYAVFQAWGNTPNQFTEGQPGEKLLTVAEKWSASAGSNESAWEKMGQYLGIPQVEPITGLPQLKLDEDVFVLNRHYPDGTRYLDWHYTIRSFNHEVIVLDTRTWRGYSQGLDQTELPMLLSPSAFEKQIKQPLEQTDHSKIEVTLLILPTNLVSLGAIDLMQGWELQKGNVFNSDVGDAWNLNQVAFSKLLAEVFRQRDRVVVLSGDIHYSGAVRLSYWTHAGSSAEFLAEEQSSRAAVEHRGKQEHAFIHAPCPKSKVLAQLTASAFKNSELQTTLVHTKIKSIALESTEDWAGWHEPPQLMEIQAIQERIRILEVEMPEKGPIIRRLYGMRGNREISWAIALKNQESRPDWQYHIEWIKRGKAVERWVSSAETRRTTLWDLVSQLWRNRWLHEGEEVVGRNNFGWVSFEWSKDDAKAVIQDVYWYPPWKPSSIVSSRYVVPLQLSDPPRQLRVIK